MIPNSDRAFDFDVSVYWSVAGIEISTNSHLDALSEIDDAS